MKESKPTTIEGIAEAVRGMKAAGFGVTHSELLGWTTPTGEVVHAIVLDKAGVQRVLVSTAVWAMLK